MERLTAEDQIMLWPDEVWPQDIGAVAILAGGDLLDPAGGIRIEAVRRVVDGRLHLVPRFRQLLYQPGRGLGGPLWVDAGTVDLAHHVRVVPVPAPGDEAALLRTVEHLRRDRLDRSRPLWEMCLLPGLPDDRVGLFVRMHHAIADGIAGVATFGAFLDPVPDPPPAAAAPWTPQPPPTAPRLFTDNLQRRGHRLGHAVVTLAHPVTTARRIRAAWPATRELLAARPAPATSLNRVVGPDRTFALVRSGLAVVGQIARTHDATINDVLLAVIAGGVRALLSGRGENVEQLTPYIDVPVTLRPVEARALARGNLIGQMMVPVPVGGSDPNRRLGLIAAETRARKANSHPSVGAVLRSRLVRRVVLKLLDRQPVNITSADLPGPPRPVYFAGARVLEVFPVLSLMGKVALGVGAISYAGQFNLTVIADRDAYPDLNVFVAGVQAELTALAGADSVLTAG
jgi:diacylglycerol O-acyltransferase / wax synthase